MTIRSYYGYVRDQRISPYNKLPFAYLLATIFSFLLDFPEPDPHFLRQPIKEKHGTEKSIASATFP